MNIARLLAPHTCVTDELTDTQADITVEDTALIHVVYPVHKMQ